MLRSILLVSVLNLLSLAEGTEPLSCRLCEGVGVVGSSSGDADPEELGSRWPLSTVVPLMVTGGVSHSLSLSVVHSQLLGFADGWLPLCTPPHLRRWSGRWRLCVRLQTWWWRWSCVRPRSHGGTGSRGEGWAEWAHPADPRSWCPHWEELTAISTTPNSVCPLPQWHIMEKIMLTLAENSADVITVS